MLLSMPHIVLDYDPDLPDAPSLPADTSALVYFLSWAYSARYGASHELADMSMLLRGEFGIDLRPLLLFADRNVEEEADEDAMRRAWQDAAPLADSCLAAAEGLSRDDERLAFVSRDYPSLRDNILALGECARYAAEHASRIRVTYVLEDEE